MLAERRVDILLAAREVDRVTTLAVCPGSLQKPVNSGNKISFATNYELLCVKSKSKFLIVSRSKL